MGKHKRYYFRGKYRLVRELKKMKECVVDPRLLSRRLALGWSAERAMTTPAGKSESFFVNWKGNRVRFSELFRKEAIEGLDYNTCRNRVLHYGWTVEKALSTPKLLVHHDQGRGIYDYFGKKMTVTELAQLPCCVVGFRTLNSRLETLGWDLYDALVTPAKCRQGDRLSPEERKKWNEWLATPNEIIYERSMQHWEEEQRRFLYRSRYGYGRKV